jgi:hypothetical protein
MTPQENAKELLDKMNVIYHMKLGSGKLLPVFMRDEQIKQCALIAIGNEIKSLMWLNVLCTFDNYMKEHIELKIKELQDTEKEIEKS